MRRFEDRNGVIMPEGYRRFLLEIGSGGDGPGYGLGVFDYSAPEPAGLPWPAGHTGSAHALLAGVLRLYGLRGGP